MRALHPRPRRRGLRVGHARRAADPGGHRWPLHGVLYSYGVPLIDNTLLEPLAQACTEERRNEFVFMVQPLKVARGTGSPVNPIAMF